MTRFSLLPLLLLSAITAAAQSTIPPINFKDPEALLAAAQVSNGLTGDDLKPWHLKASYELFDDDGKPLGNGVFEEWWAAKNKWKRSYTGDHYTGADYRSPEGVAHEGDIPWPEVLLADAVVSPIPDHFDKSLTPRPLAIAQTQSPLNCIQVSSKETAEKLHTDPYAYCFDDGTAVLRIRTAMYVVATYTSTGSFQKRFVGTEITIQVNHQALARIHVQKLVTEPDMKPEVVSPTGQTKFTPLPADDARKITPPKLIRTVVPDYRNLPRSDLVEGIVVVRIRLDGKGHINDIHVLESPSPRLAKVAIETVRQYQFRPAFMEKRPVATGVDVQIYFRHF